MPWQSSADQTEKKHTGTFSRAREGEAPCERYTGNKNHTVVLEVRTANNDHTQWCLKASANHAVAEFQREGQKTVLRVSAKRCCKLANHGAREHLPGTDDHAVAQYYVVVLDLPEESAEW